MMDRPNSVLVVVPTYNECENIRTLANQVLSAVPNADLLIIDDNSPDGTGVTAEAMSRECSAIHVLHRPGKEGLGRAYIAGFDWGLRRHYAAFVQMDADLSHDPRDIPRLLCRLQDADLILGSRYVAGGRTCNWGPWRRALSRFGSLYASRILCLPLKDLTGGFKCWDRDALAAIGLETLTSTGYSFQIETTWRASRRGVRIVEEPIVFVERAVGRSKMCNAIIREAIGVVWRLRREAAVTSIAEYRTYDTATATEAST